MTRLPSANPVCQHDWEVEHTRCAYVCASCGYRLTWMELEEEHEGQVLPGMPPPGMGPVQAPRPPGIQ